MESKKYRKNVLPPLTLTVQQETEFRHLARELVHETIVHANLYHRLPESEKNLTRHKRWKKVKTRDNLTIFKERYPPKLITGTSFDTPEHQRLTKDEWKTPTLLVGVGAIVGSLDDVMYGVVTPDAQAMLLQATLMRSSIKDGAVLAQIDGPTLESPFQFIGIKWFVRESAAIVRSFVQPQDLVVIEATGVLTYSTGDRFGYQLLHSVDLDGYGTISGCKLTRGKFSSCTIFKEKQDGRRVDVYVRGYVEQHGNLLDSVALKATSTGFLSSCNAFECSHVKKLRWFLENPHLVTWKKDATTDSQHSDAQNSVGSHASTSFNGSNSIQLRSSTASSINDHCGGTCGRKMNKPGMCSLCHVLVCFKCCVAKKLILTSCDLRLDCQESVICRSCVARVRLEPVLSIAKQEIRQGRYRFYQSNHPEPETVTKTQGLKSVPPSPSDRNARSNPTLNPIIGFKEPTVGKHSNVVSFSADVCARALECHPQLEQQPNQAFNAQLHNGRGSYWFNRHKKRDQVNDKSRPVLLGESTMLRECQSRTLSQCSTLFDSISTTSLTSPIDYCGHVSVQDSERNAVGVVDDSKEGWPDAPKLHETKREREELWHQMMELQIAVENTYQFAKRTTASCCGVS